MDGSYFLSAEAADDFHLGFDPVKYQIQNYHQLISEDAAFIEASIDIIKSLGMKFASYNMAIDIGNGGVPIGPALISPLLKDDGVSRWYDIGDQQLAHAQTIAVAGAGGDIGVYQKHENLMASHDVRWKGAIKRACRLSEIFKSSLAELEPGEADAGSMFYVSESVTGQHDEFVKGTGKFLDAIRSNGLVLWAAMIESEGYDSPGSMFSSVPITPEDMRQLLRPKVKNLHILYVDSSHGARREDGPSYGGMALAIGIKR